MPSTSHLLGYTVSGKKKALCDSNSTRGSSGQASLQGGAGRCPDTEEVQSPHRGPATPLTQHFVINPFHRLHHFH